MDGVNTTVGFSAIGASLVVIISGLAVFTKFITRRFVSAVKEVVTDQMVGVKQQLTVEFSGNGGGAREAINELHVKVDEGFDRAHRERDELLERVNSLEKERVIRDETTEENP